ncbi:signal transduction protein [Hahella sp. CCB-MM4]|uniref:DUF1631 family protein n=1 Tax=Hahella sp. (strain CCB-MM4) TaxID=1926491 RepID=UPI000B9C1AF6|nr:DUF1631 family protein [Hahella sp. CCB-MM4]OZG74937.1 signal transduction protein [Hahella sp. CCB-MM4]
MSEPPIQPSDHQGAERRGSKRRPIQLLATIDYRGEPGLQCEIADFCAEGVFVKLSDVTTQKLNKLQFGPGQIVQLTFHDPFVNRDHSLSVKAVRTMNGAFGGMFTNGNTGAITALLRICGAENLKVSQKQMQPESAALLMRQCERIIQSHLSPLVSNFITALAKAFDEALTSAATDNQKTELVDSVISLRQQSALIAPQFFKYISQALVPRNKGQESDENSSGPDLSLIDKAEFEDWLTLKVMVTKAETTYRAHLLQLKMRFDALGIHCQKGYSNPVGPALICYAFRDTLIGLKLPLSAERLCLKQFELSVMADLEPLYQELDDLLVRQGVLPDLDLSKYIKTPEQSEKTADSKEKSVAEKLKAPETQKPAPAKPPASPPNERQVSSAKTEAPKEQKTEQEEPDNVTTLHSRSSRKAGSFSEVSSYLATAEQSVAAVNRLLAVLHQKPRVSGSNALAGSPFPSQEQAPTFKNEEVLANLSQVQTAPVYQDSQVDDSLLRDRLYHMMNSNHMGLKSFTEEQDKNLDVVDRFFCSTLKNPKLTSIAKMQIKGLEVPVLRLLMRNPSFFEQTDNSAQKLINRIAQVGVKGGRMNAHQVEKINRVVSRIQEEHEHDPAVFEEALADVDELVERQNLLYRRNVERVTAAAEGQQKVEEARIAVTDALRNRVFGRQIPKAIAALINGGWKDLLSLVYIRQGPESQAWQDYLSVIDTLLAISRDPEYQYNLPDLLRMIQEGLATISSNHMPSGQIRDELKRFLVKAPGGVEPEMMEMADEAEEESAQDISLIQDARQRGLQRWINRAQKLSVGDWLRLERDSNEPEFIRLVWIGKNFTRYVFVNHQGMKVIDLDASTLAAYLQKGIAVPDPGVSLPVVDQSLDMMVKDLYEQLSFASTRDELTGLMLRKEFERQVLVRHTSLAPEDTISCILFSLAQFRLINDSAGTEAGDEILKEVANLLNEHMPKGALISRFSGDEFMVVISEPAEKWVSNFMEQMKRYRLNWMDHTYEAPMYAGYVEVKGGLLDVRHLVQAAEDACRSAKRKGTGSIEEFTVDQQQIAQRDAIANKVASLGKKLDDERLLLRCQKIIPLRSDSTVGTQHEILLSIYDDDGQLIPASKFIRAAENYKRMQEVDRWVVGHMLDWMVNNHRKISQIGGLSINLSGHSLNDESLLEFIFERLTKQDSPIEKITFELTEASAISNLHNISDFIQELQEYGCRFCLGNYGSGVASYQYLKQLPVDMIKIDGTFIRELEKDQNDQMMVRSMTEMAHYLNREVIAPQVETKEAFEVLKQLGVDYAQGYYIERPKSLANLWSSLG